MFELVPAIPSHINKERNLGLQKGS
uniref:Uncharacterized protein n=1 Tax=Arundo donax TaxID=35708 RepID=A0A0A9BB62_ARUDO